MSLVSVPLSNPQVYPKKVFDVDTLAKSRV